jgi:hypothetical protein
MQTLFHANQISTAILFLIQIVSIFISMFCYMSVVISSVLQLSERGKLNDVDYIQYSKLTLYSVLAATVAIAIHLAVHYGIIK